MVQPELGELSASGRSAAKERLFDHFGERAGFPFRVYAHMLRHACGYALANAGHDTRGIQDWLGHRAIQNIPRAIRN